MNVLNVYSKEQIDNMELSTYSKVEIDNKVAELNDRIDDIESDIPTEYNTVIFENFTDFKNYVVGHTFKPGDMISYHVDKDNPADYSIDFTGIVVREKQTSSSMDYVINVCGNIIKTKYNNDTATVEQGNSSFFEITYNNKFTITITKKSFNDIRLVTVVNDTPTHFWGILVTKEVE